MGIFSGARAEHYSTEARRYVRRGEWLMAISFFRKALEEAPNRATCHYNLGLCLMQALALRELNGAKVVIKAIEHYRNALLLEMNYPEAWCLFAKATWLLVQSARLEGRSGQFEEDTEKIAAAAAMASALLLEKKRGPVREDAVEVLIEIAMRRGYTSAEDLARFQLDAAEWLFTLFPWVLGIERDEFFRRFKKEGTKLFLWIGRISGLVQIFATIAFLWSLVQAHWAHVGVAAAVFAAALVVGHVMRLITGWDVE